MPALHLLIKPASLSCNMRCSYCFSFDIAKNREKESYGIMPLDILEDIVRKTLATSEQQCTFAFQGGEPTLAGLDFYKSLVEMVTRYNTKNIDVQYALQTNGYKINKEWAVFFKENRFLIGLSLDGIREVHDLFRRDVGGRGTFSKTMQTAELFRRWQVDFNILTVVTAQTAKRISQIYRFFSRNDFLFQQYIPCLDPLSDRLISPTPADGDNKESNPQTYRGLEPYSLTPERYGDFLMTLFDLWYDDFAKGKRVSIRYFDNLIHMIMGYPPEICAMMGYCTKQLIVEADGSVYPCDFYVLDEYRLGNLRTDEFTEIEKNRDASGFIAPSLKKSPICDGCTWYPLCRGGCRRDRDIIGKTDTLHNYYCAAYRKFFEYAYFRLEMCARSLLKELP